MKEEKQNNSPVTLHIDIGNQSLTEWVNENKFIIHSELVRYSETLINGKLESIQAILVSNFTDNVVFLLNKETVHLTLSRAMEYFLEIEEYEICGKIRDLYILIKKIEDEAANSKNSKSNKRKLKIH